MAQQIDSTWLTAVLLNNQVLLDYERGRFGTAIERLRHLRDLMHGTGWSDDLWHVEWAVIHIMAGDLATARDTIAHLARVPDPPALLPHLQITFAVAADDAEHGLEIARHLGANPDFVPLGIDLILHCAPSYAEAVAGDADAALRAGMAIDDRLGSRGHEPLRLDAHLVIGTALRRLGRLDEARIRLAWAVDRATTMDAARIGWRLLAELADVESMAGHALAADAARTRARQLVERIAKGMSDDLRSGFLDLPAVRRVTSVS